MQEYGRIAPYVDLPLPELKKTIRDLNGIKPDDRPGQLQLILEKTGDAITLQLPRVPNLICREDVADEAPPKLTRHRYGYYSSSLSRDCLDRCSGLSTPSPQD